MKLLFRKIHLWLSVPFGVVITLICFSGAMLVFEKELTDLISSDIRRVDKVEGEPMPIDVVAAAVAHTLPEGVSVTGVTVSRNPDEAYKVNLSKPRRAAVYVDQYTGEIKGRQERPAFFATMFSLHRWLLDTGRPDGRPAYGKTLVGISTIMFVIALVTGVVVWWPACRQAGCGTRKALRSSLKLVVGKGGFRLWRSLHVAGGMYAVVLLLAMALTGLTWSFSWYNTAFYAVFGMEAPQRGGGHGSDSRQSEAGGAKGGDRESRPACRQAGCGGEHGRGSRNGNRGGEHGSGGISLPACRQACPGVWQSVYDNLAACNPDAAQITVGDGTATVSYAGFGNTRAADRYTFDPSTGRIVSTVKYADSPDAGKLRGWIYSVHVGSFGGLFTRVLWFLAALLGASLPLTGYYLWIRRGFRS